jgi:DNA polymerase I-like protein with 3'-5' exonuclease and polymerase domains
MERSLCVRDEILLKAPIEAVDEVALILKDTMEEAGKVLLKIVPVEAEVVVFLQGLPGFYSIPGFQP